MLLFCTLSLSPLLVAISIKVSSSLRLSWLAFSTFLYFWEMKFGKIDIFVQECHQGEDKGGIKPRSIVKIDKKKLLRKILNSPSPPAITSTSKNTDGKIVTENSLLRYRCWYGVFHLHSTSFILQVELHKLDLCNMGYLSKTLQEILNFSFSRNSKFTVENGGEVKVTLKCGKYDVIFSIKKSWA